MTDFPKVPKTMDWVKARAECSIQSLFVMLEAVVEADAKAANERAGRALRFKCSRQGAGTLLVIREYTGGGFVEGEAVVFQVSEDTIVVSRRGPKLSEEMFKAKPHVDVNGECKFEVAGAPLETWQVSKRALEDLFFRHGLATTT